MAFNKLINSKKIVALFAALLLGGTDMLMAQTAATASAADAGAAKAQMWTNVNYYVMLFLLVCLGIAVIGRI